VNPKPLCSTPRFEALVSHHHGFTLVQVIYKWMTLCSILLTTWFTLCKQSRLALEHFRALKTDKPRSRSPSRGLYPEILGTLGRAHSTRHPSAAG